MKLKGQEHTSWTKWESRYNSVRKTNESHAIHFSGSNTFLTLQLNLQGEGKQTMFFLPKIPISNATMNNTILIYYLRYIFLGVIEMGTYEYHFEYVLPYNLPSTFRGYNGYIRYSLTANVEIPNAFDYKEEKIINVISPINFNTMLDRIILVCI